LSVARQEIAALIAVGYSNEDMARLLSVPEGSIAARVQDLYYYANISTRAELSRWAAGQSIDAAVQARILAIRGGKSTSGSVSSTGGAANTGTASMGAGSPGTAPSGTGTRVVGPEPPPVKPPDPVPAKDPAAGGIGKELVEMFGCLVGGAVVIGGGMLLLGALGWALRLAGIIKPH